MFGGTPSNLGMTFLETNRVEVITGVDLSDAHQARDACRSFLGPAGGGARMRETGGMRSGSPRILLRGDAKKRES